MHRTNGHYADCHLFIHVFRSSVSKAPIKGLRKQYLQVVYCESGTDVIFLGDKQYIVHPGDLFVMNNMPYNMKHSDTQSSSKYIVIHFSPTLLEMEDPMLLKFFSTHPFIFLCNQKVPEESLQPEQLILNIWEEHLQQNSGYKTAIKSYLFQLCIHIHRKCKQMNNVHIEQKIQAYDKVLPLLQYIEKHFHEDISIQHLAELICLSTSRTSRLFQEVTGKKFKDYLHSIRLQFAQNMLSHSNQSITHICFESGYQSVASFYRNFKKYVGVSPQQYRLKVVPPTPKEKIM